MPNNKFNRSALKIQTELYERRNLEEWRVNKDGLLGDVDDVLHLLELGRQVVEVAHVDHARDLHLVQRVGGHQREVVLQGNVRAGVQEKRTKNIKGVQETGV